MDEKITLGALIFMVCVWALEKLFGSKNKTLEKNTEATLQNTMAILELKLEMKYVNEALKDQKKIKDDLTSLHSKIRMLERENKDL